MYYITNGLYYISLINSQYQPVAKAELATTWKEKKKASNILKSALPVVLRNRGYHIVEIDEKKEAKEEKTASPVVVQKRQYVSKPLRKCGIPEVEEMIKKIDTTVGTIANIAEMSRICADAMSKQDRIQEDLLHRMEFESGAKGQGAHMFAEMQKCRRRRRVYKDMLELLNYIGGMMGSVTTDAVEQFEKKLETRTYVPRSEEAFK